MFKKTLAFKLTIGFVVIVFISMLVIGVFFIHMFRQYTFDTKEKTMLEKAHNISDLIAENTLSNGQMHGFGGLIRFLDTMTEADVWITDSVGNPAVFSGMGMGMGMGKKFNSEPIPDEAKKVIHEVLSGKDSVSQSFSSVYKETTLTVGVPVFDTNNTVTGSVFLHAPITGITPTLNKAVSILSVSIAIALFLAIALGLFYSLLFTRPLKTMNSIAIEMTNGNYSVRTGIRSKDELGQLGGSLDLLASKLSYTINQLFQEKGKMSDIISSISEGLVAFDLELKPLNYNNALSDIMNRSQPYKSELLVRDFDALEINSLLTTVINEKKSCQIIKTWVNKKLKFTLSPIIDNNENVTGCVVLVQDISESERLEQLRKDFIANVSHEFRTPLTVIKGSIEALNDGAIEKKEDIERYYSRILSETKILQRLVGDLLELSRLQSGKISVNEEKVHIPSLLSDVTKSMQTIAVKKQISIEYSPIEAVPPVLGDYDRLRQLFTIFIDNAIKYSPEKTKISIEIAVKGTLEIKIADKGYGISEEELPYVWERFYKTDKSRESNGTGLGLSIAKHLIQLHGGNVTMQSSLEEGTTVTVYLPYSE
ncbi:integral membrane sensor signal transduction histidine kinase [Ruminiclostridium papyrosolvens DSM 2782]|uniref:histidine kinase n=1 Tax=Ruminiclostridium papyrosolvens DSM 2782 TaxID=588581 RepID=F1TDE4_9FIRM|nr:ATP-binding protein [Ruminiclostridium papyrosolvens]EGD47582.1 integral membrane sensor signal transduction histidine kinase [Ruminiclostridium papyrosolvens DSM 2782]WES36473.1 ATP-binding protein [Ruminiclostridium papyrosolvens DSM 2782]